MGRRGGGLGSAIARAFSAWTPGHTLAEEPLGRAGWLRLEVESSEPTWARVELSFSATATLSRPGHEGLFLHPFALTLSTNGETVGAWDDTLSAHWDLLIRHVRTEHAERRDHSGQGAERLEVGGSLPLVDVRLPAGLLEIHLKLPWHDRDKREGFEASSELGVASLRVSSLGALGRMFGTRALERVQVGF